MTSSSISARTSSKKMWLARHPESGGVMIAAVAWITLVVQHWSDHASSVGPWRFDVANWSLMVVAMMLPGVLPMMRRIGFVSRRSWIRRAPLIFAATYLGVWIVVGLAAAGAVAALSPLNPPAPGPPYLTAAILLVAAGWQLTSTKRNFLAARHQDVPLAPRGWPAARSLLILGFRHAQACAGSCWAMMVAMFAAGHDLHLMVPLTVVVVAERWPRLPSPAIGAVALSALALVSILG